jgi:hypothetical protein
MTSSAISWKSGHLVVFPWLIEIILGSRPASVLDYNGGDGKFLAELRRQFAGELWHYDPFQALAAKAKPWETRMSAFAKMQTRSKANRLMSWHP